MQLIIKALFNHIQKKGFNITDVNVVPFPLFNVLDGKNTNDYVQRVESIVDAIVEGVDKMAKVFLNSLMI